MDEETSAEGKERQRKALQRFAKESVRGVWQQQTRGKTKERAGTLQSTCSEYVQKECVGTRRSRSAERGSREWRTNYSSRRSRRIWDYLFKRRRSCSQAQLQEVYQSFFLKILLKDLHHNGDAFLEDSWRWLEQSGKIPLYTRLGTVTIEIHLSVSSGKFK